MRTVRSQLAVVRSLVDELERLTAGPSPRIDGQLVEELATLGCRVFETAAQIAHEVEDAPEESGVHARTKPTWLGAGLAKATPSHPVSQETESRA